MVWVEPRWILACYHFCPRASSFLSAGQDSFPCAPPLTKLNSAELKDVAPPSPPPLPLPPLLPDISLWDIQAKFIEHLSLKNTLHNTYFHWTLHSAKYTLHNKHFILNNIQFAMQNTYFTLYNRYFTLHNPYFTLHNTHFSLHNTHFTLHNTHFSLHNTHFSMHNAPFTLDNTNFTLHNTHFTLHLVKVWGVNVWYLPLLLPVWPWTVADTRGLQQVERLYNCTTVQLYNCTTVQLYSVLQVHRVWEGLDDRGAGPAEHGVPGGPRLR